MPRYAQKRSRSSTRYSPNKRYKKTAYKMKRKSYRRKGARSSTTFNKKVLQVIKKTAEPKKVHNLLSIGSLHHNSFNFVQIYNRGSTETIWPPQGDGIGQRNGDEIYSKGFMIRGSFCFAGDRRGSTIRMYMINPKDNDIAVNYNNMFENITDNVAFDPLNKRVIPSSKLLGTYRVPDRSAPTVSVEGNFELIDTNVLVKKWIPFDKKIQFVPGTRAPTNINAYMFLVFTVYDHNTALETDICVKETDLMCTFYYSDP